MLLYEEERSIKSKKWVPKTLKGVLVGYDSHTIYWVYIKNQKKVIRVKDLCIFEDYKTKTSTELPDYDNDKPTFQGFLSEDNDEQRSEKLSSICIKSQKVENTKEKQLISDTRTGQKVSNTEPVSTIACAS